MSTVTQGLYITVIGMGLVFLTLSIILVLMILLTRIFPAKDETPTETHPPPSRAEPTDIESEKVAAISVAIEWALAEEHRSHSPAPGSVSGNELTNWAAAGRSRQLNTPRSREKRL